jgi:hypothetical protein
LGVERHKEANVPIDVREGFVGGDGDNRDGIVLEEVELNI